MGRKARAFGGRGSQKKTEERAGKRGIRVAVASAVSALLVVLAAQASGAAQASPDVASGPAASVANVAVLDVVMLVDESGSETPAEVADEKRTVETIAQAMLSPLSRVTVIGFGGVNHVVPDQDPVNVACQPTIASGPANLNYLASCVSSLHRRTEAEGDDTDYAAALGQAMTYFNPDTAFGKQSPAGAIKVVLMMTDGGADVHRDTQQYGTNWMLGEQQAVAQQLAVARQHGVQLWPLGFGTDITPQDASYLGQLAKGGAQDACDSRPESRPHYRVVNNPADAVSAFEALYAQAACLGSSASAPAAMGEGTQAGTLRVTIPSIASDAAISIDRGNPGVQVSFQMPGGAQWTDSSAISGQGSPVEVLHLDNLTAAEAGTWTVKLTAAPGLAGQLVKATAFWQGAVRAVMTADPPSVGLGQPIAVTLSVLGPNGPLTDSSELSGLQVAVRVSGDGLAGSTPLRVSNTGETPGSPTGVGNYQGTFTAPQASGILTFTGTAAGYGLYATKIPVTVQVSEDIPSFTATVQPPLASSVQAGGSIQGEVTFVNKTGATRKVLLELSASRALAFIASPSGPLAVTSGSPPAVPFTITVSKNAPAGSTWLTVKAVDAMNPRLVYSDATFVLTVTGASGFRAGYLWMIIVIVAALVLLSLGWLWRRRADARGLIAILRRDGEQVGPELAAPRGTWSGKFRFIIYDSPDEIPRLDYPERGQYRHAYTFSRTLGGGVRLRTPAGTDYAVAVGGPGEYLADGSELACRDTRRRMGFLRPPARRESQGSTAAPDSAGQPVPQTADQSTTTASARASVQWDEWL